jgi:nitronate monooxygenase
VAADERSTALILRSLKNTARVFGNAVARQAIEMEREGKGIDEIGPVVAGSKGRAVYETGDIDRGIWSAGTSMGLIHDIPTCRELVERIVREAEGLIRGRLAGMMR